MQLLSESVDMEAKASHNHSQPTKLVEWQLAMEIVGPNPASYHVIADT